MTKRSLYAAAAGAIVVTVAATVAVPITAAIQQNRSACGSCDWAESNQANLPSTLAELAAYPVVYRRAAFGLLSAEHKASLAREQIQLLIESKEDWTPKQTELLLTLSGLATAATYMPGTAEQRAVRNPSFDAEVRKHLGTHRSALTELGSLSSPDNTMASIRLRLGRSFADLFTVHAASPKSSGKGFEPECSCSEYSDWCSPTPTSPSADCESQDTTCPCTTGCGTMWSYVCDGFCDVSQGREEPDEPLPCFVNSPEAGSCAAPLSPHPGTVEGPKNGVVTRQ